MCKAVPFLRCLLLLVLAAAAIPALAQRGAVVVPRNLDELTAQAATIVHGQVTSAVVERHPQLKNLDTVVVTVKVLDALKGSPGGTFTFRQYIWDIRDRTESAKYKKGQELLLLMNSPSRHGLSSPAGLDQGRFRVSRDRKGNAVAVNGRGNSRLLEGLQAKVQEKGLRLSVRASAVVAQHRSGPLPLDDLKEIIRRLVGAQP
jgi:hypothetical protein